MLLVGETPCSAAATAAGMKCSVLPLAEQQTQMAIWSMASAPLLLSADLTNIPNESMAILTNPIALKINQDPQGRMPFRFISDTVRRVWTSGARIWYVYTKRRVYSIFFRLSRACLGHFMIIHVKTQNKRCFRRHLAKLPSPLSTWELAPPRSRQKP